MTEKHGNQLTGIMYSYCIRKRGQKMQRLSVNGALFIFMDRGEKLTYDATWNQNIWPSQRYVLWPRAEFWVVRYKSVEDGKLCWLPVTDDPLTTQHEA